MIVVLASVATVLALPLLAWAVAPGSAGTAQAHKRVVEGFADVRRSDLDKSSLDRVVIPFLQAVSEQARRLTPIGVVESTAEKLAISGLARRLPLEALLGLKVLLALLLATIAVAVTSVGLATTVLAAAVAGGIGFMLPDVYVTRVARARQEEIKASLPDVLDQLTVTVEAGLGFDSAMARVIKTSNGPLVDEMARALRNVRLGRSRSEALDQMVDRTAVPEVRQLVTAIKQADKMGVPIAHVLRTQGGHIRELRRLAAEEQAMKLPVKLVFPMVFCMLPALFVVLLGPVFIRITSSGL